MDAAVRPLTRFNLISGNQKSGLQKDFWLSNELLGRISASKAKRPASLRTPTLATGHTSVIWPNVGDNKCTISGFLKETINQLCEGLHYKLQVLSLALMK